MSTGQTSSQAPQPVHSHEFRANSSPGFTWRRSSRSSGPRISYCRSAKIRPLRGGRAKEDRRMAVGFRCDFPGLRQGDLLLERIAGSAAAGTHARHRLRLSDESAHIALDLGDRVERIDAGHYRGTRRVRARDRLELRELGLLPAAHFLEGDFDPHLRHRGVRQIVEGQALHDGPDRAREGVRLPPDLRAQGTWPPQNPMDFWMRPRGYQDLPLVAESHGPDGSDAPAELLLRRLGHHLGRPGWLPDDVHDRLLDALELFVLSLRVLVDVCRSGASGGGEGHLDINLALVRLEVDVVHQTEVIDVDRDLGVVALPQDADHFFLRGHGSAFDRTYVGRGILTFRFRRERLAARESTAQGVPPSDPVLPPLPAQVDDLVSDPPGEVDQPAMQVLHLAAEGEDRVNVRLDGPIQVGLFLQQVCIRLSVP